MATNDPDVLARLRKPVKGMHQHTRRSEAEKRLREAYAKVDERDGGICWVTGAYVTPFHPDPHRRREHNHLKGRRVRPDWRDKPERIITVSAFVHGLITAHAIEIEGDDARKALRFHWAKHFTERPIVIRSRRRSQRSEDAA